MANNIKARIYKNRIAALKYAKKVQGHIVKHIDTVHDKHGKYCRELDKITYIVYAGEYKCLS